MTGVESPPAAAQSATPAAPATWRQLLSEVDACLSDRLESRRIVEHVSGLNAAGILAHLDDVAPTEAIERTRTLVARRRSGEPLQCVVGRWGFRGLDVKVDGRALIPRPETELLVDHALDEWDRVVAGNGGGYAADLGTGSGVIALSLAAEREDIEVFAVDRSPAALALARENLGELSERARRRVHLLDGSWFSPLPHRLAGRTALVVSNPPYVAAGEWAALDSVVRDHDPYEALVAGPTGLEAIAHVVATAPAWLVAGGALVVEIAPGQQAAVLALTSASASYSSATVAKDLAGRPRVLVARRASW